MSNTEVKEMLEREYQKGVLNGIKLMQERLLLACENGNPINIEGKGYFIKSDIQNLRDIFADLDKQSSSEHKQDSEKSFNTNCRCAQMNTTVIF